MDNKNNILKAISSYNSTNVESAILTLKKELQQQVLINTTLKDKDLKKKAKEITDFVARNEGQIDDQIKRLNDVVNNLKKVVSENYKLEQNKDIYSETVKSDKSIAVAVKINELKELKKNALLFLENAGIDPQMNTNSL
tara:strand:- start:1003 stop:1419 length:417 start_codon:yes stop_codon:yes gene_type:complete